MRHLMLLCCSVVPALVACAPQPSTELVIDSPGQPGAVVSYGGQRTTLDAAGHGVLRVGVLHSTTIAFGETSSVAIVDAMNQAVTLRFESGGLAISLRPECVPTLTESEPIERAYLRLRRVVADSSCRLVNPTTVVGGAEQTGSYEPTQFDDAPCGPFATGN